jgi:O-antigen/teichoic acid export membrane protein
MTLAHKVVLNSGAQAGRQLLTALMGVTSVAIVTRYLSISDYGQVIAAMVVVSMFATIGDFGITATAARMMAQEPDRRDRIVASALWTWVAFVLAGGATVLLVSAIAYQGPEHALTRQCVLIILVSSTLLSPLAGVANVTAILDQRVWVMALSTTVARIIALAVIVTAISLDLGAIGVTLGFGTGFLLEALFGILLIRPHLPFGRPDFSGIRVVVAAAMPLGLVMVVNSLYFRIDAFLLTLLGSSKDVAIYGVAYKAFEMLIPLTGFVMITLLPELARVKPDDPRFARLVQKAFTAMCMLSLLLAGFAPLGSEAMTFLGSSKYAEGGFVFSFVVLSVAIGCVQGVFGYTLVSQGRPGILLKVSLLNLGVNGVLNLIAIPIWGVRGAAVALCISEVTSLTCTMLVYRGIAPLPRLEMPLRLGAALVAMVAAMAVRFAVSDSEIVRLLIGGAVGVPTYFATLVLLRAVPSYIAEPILAGFGRARGRPS